MAYKADLLDLATAHVVRDPVKQQHDCALPRSTSCSRVFSNGDSMSLHGARPVPLVKKFYDGYFGMTAGFTGAAPDGEERLGHWKTRKSKRD